MLMKKLSFNKPLLFSLITALLFLQWSTTHIHLAGEHEHDGAQHQHDVTSHQHQFAIHHADAIDVANVSMSHADNYNVIEIDNVCTQFHGKLAKLFNVIPAASNIISQRIILSKRVATSYLQDIHQTYLQYTSIRLRAPPITV